MKIVEIREKTIPISSPIRNAYIDFSKMTLSLVAVITDVIRDGKPVVGYGFNSNGRYGQGGLIRERFRDRILARHVLSPADLQARNAERSVHVGVVGYVEVAVRGCLRAKSSAIRRAATYILHCWRIWLSVRSVHAGTPGLGGESGVPAGMMPTCVLSPRLI